MEKWIVVQQKEKNLTLKLIFKLFLFFMINESPRKSVDYIGNKN